MRGRQKAGHAPSACLVDDHEEQGMDLTENDLVFVTNGCCTEGTASIGDAGPRPLTLDTEVRTSGMLGSVEEHRHAGPRLRPPGEVLLRHRRKTNWMSRPPSPLWTSRILPYITEHLQAGPLHRRRWSPAASSAVQDSNWLLSWTFNRQPQFKDISRKASSWVWVYGLFTDVPGDYVKKPMRGRVPARRSAWSGCTTSVCRRSEIPDLADAQRQHACPS